MSKRLRIQQAATSIVAADTILITAGAGMGVNSGLPDFRGQQGFWKTHPSYAAAGLSFSDLANPIWFERDPARAWGLLWLSLSTVSADSSPSWFCPTEAFAG